MRARCSGRSAAGALIGSTARSWSIFFPCFRVSFQGCGRMVDPFLLTAFVSLQLSRLWILATLRNRWTTRVIVVSGAPLVTGGPYRFVRHPNYVGVACEIALVPLALGLPGYSAVFTILHVPLLLKRIQVENRALACASLAPPSGA